MIANVKLSAVLAEVGFTQRLGMLEKREARQVLDAIYWFEFKCGTKERKAQSSSVNESHRRRLRYIRASNRIRVVYATGDDGMRRWVWVGSLAEMYETAGKIDASPNDQLVSISDMFADAGEQESVEQGSEDDLAPPRDEVASLSASIDNAGLFIADAKSVSESIMELLARANAQRDQERTRRDESERKAREDSGPTVALALYNELRAERDMLLERVKAAEKRAKACEFTGMQVEQIRKMATEEQKTLRRESDRLRSELAAARAALKPVTAESLPDKAKDDLKERCAKVCDEQAMILSRTGRPSLVEQAEELRRIGVIIRALKL